MSGDARRLLAFALGTFHAAVLLSVVLLLVYLTGRLGEALAGLDTRIGVALFVMLWATTWWSTARALRGLPATPPPLTSLGRGLFWGGVNGVLLLVVLLIPFTVLVALRAEFWWQVPLVALLYGGFGAGFAFAIGALLGGVFGLLDRALLAVVGSLEMRARAEERVTATAGEPEERRSP